MAGGAAALGAVNSLARFVTDRELLETALTHSSFAHEVGEGVSCNERLEFLGDAVVQLAVTDWLYRHHAGSWDEGRLSEARAAIVRESSLAGAAAALGLGPQLRLGRGEAATGGRRKPSILADAFEAVVGASYLSTGWETAAELVLGVLAPALLAAGRRERDAKTTLAERVIRQGHVPRYEVVAEEGPEHAKIFTVAVIWDGREHGRGQGRSKKAAEQAAAAAVGDRWDGGGRDL